MVFKEVKERGEDSNEGGQEGVLRNGIVAEKEVRGNRVRERGDERGDGEGEEERKEEFIGYRSRDEE